MNYTLITGASSGLGLEFAKLLASKGHNLILVARSKDKLLAIKEQLSKTYLIKCEVIVKDLSLKSSALELFNQTRALNMHVDYLINNAGFGDHAFFLSSNLERQLEMIEVNVTSLLQLTYYYAKEMQKHKFGKILNVSSIAGISGGPYMATYYATKNFVLSFSLSLHTELKKSGISVTALCPGPTETNFEEKANLKNNSKMFSLIKPASAKKVCKTGYQAMMKGKAYVFYGFTNKLMNFSMRFVSKKTASKFAGWVNTKPFTK